jgi:hypothetical protein
MRYVTKVILTMVSALLLASTGVPFAQPPAGGPPGRRYDPATVETVRGEVTAVDTVVQGRRGPGVHVKLATMGGPLAVRLGPAWYLEEQKLAPKVGDVLEITGSRVTVAGEPVIIAAQVKQGDRTVMLRDAGGLPLWRGRGGQGRCCGGT